MAMPPLILLNILVCQAKQPSEEFLETCCFLLDMAGERGERSMGLVQLQQAGQLKLIGAVSRGPQYLD